MLTLGPDDDLVALLGRAPRRLLVAGVSGAGKTTLARRVGELLSVPRTELDSLFHGPGWTRLPTFLADVRALVAGDAWVTEWQYTDARPLLLGRAEVLVWLDLPTAVAMRQVVARTVRRSVRREPLWNGNLEPGLWHALTHPDGIIRWAWRTRHHYRELTARVVQEQPGLAVVRLRSHAESQRWLDCLAADVARHPALAPRPEPARS